MKNAFLVIPFMAAGICFPVFLSGNLAAQNNPKTLAFAIMANSRPDLIHDFLFSVINDKTILQRMEASGEYHLDLVWRTHDTSPHYQRIYTRSCRRAETHDRPGHCSQRFLRMI